MKHVFPAAAIALVLVLVIGAGIHAWKTGRSDPRLAEAEFRQGPRAVAQAEAKAKAARDGPPRRMRGGVYISEEEYRDAPRKLRDIIVRYVLNTKHGEFPQGVGESSSYHVSQFDAWQLDTYLQLIREAGMELDERRRGSLVLTVVESLVLLKPEKSLEVCVEYRDLLLARQPEKQGFKALNFFLSLGLRQMAKFDPDGAARWVNIHAAADFPSSPLESFQTAILGGMAQDDTGEAFAFIDDVGIKDRAEAVATIVSATPNTLDGLMDAFNGYRIYRASLPDAAAREALVPGLRGFGEVLGRTEFAEGFEFLEKGGLTPAEVSAMVTHVDLVFVGEEPGQWIGWLLEKTPRDVSKPAIEGIFPKWFATDRDFAVAWAEKIPPGALRNDFLLRVQRAWPENDREGAAAFAKKHGLKPPEAMRQ